MLKKIQSFFETHFMLEESGDQAIEHQLNMAAAALLIEMTLQDDEAHEAEVESVKQHLMTELGLSEVETHDLYTLAEAEKHESTDYHQFTRLIAERYSQAQKIRLIESLWEVAFADQVLDKYEEHMVRKIADLIYVPHREFIQARHRVEERLGL